MSTARKTNKHRTWLRKFTYVALDVGHSLRLLYNRGSHLGYMYRQWYICLSEEVHLRLAED